MFRYSQDTKRFVIFYLRYRLTPHIICFNENYTTQVNEEIQTISH